MSDYEVTLVNDNSEWGGGTESLATKLTQDSVYAIYRRH